MYKHIKDRFELCKNCGEPILLNTEMPEKLGEENPWKDETFLLHLPTLTNNCMITAEHSGKFRDVEYEEIDEEEEEEIEYTNRGLK